jgi:PAS domain S-box-containing protein
MKGVHMQDEEKTREQLSQELAALRQRIAELETIETEYRQGQEALRRERDLVARIAETSPVGITVVNRAGQIVFANAQAQRVLGLTKDGITQRTYNAPEWRITDYTGNLFPDEELPFRRVMTTGQPVFDVRHAIEWPTGQRVFLSINAAPLFDESGQADGMVAIVEDVTARVQAAEALRESQERYRLIAENMSDTVWLMDMDLQITYISPSVQRLRGYSLEELRTLPLDRQMPPESLAVALEALAQEMTEERLAQKDPPISRTLELEFYRKDGSTFWSENTFTLIRDSQGYPVGILGVGRDITARKQTEEELRASERRYQTLAEVAPVGIFRTDALGQTTYVNPRWCEISGLAASGALDDGWQRAVHPDDHEQIAAGWKEAVQANTISRADYRFLRPDGTIAWVIGQAIPETDHKGRVIGYVGTITDITERKRVEQALRDSEGKYRQLVDTLQEGIWAIDQDAHTTFVNPRMAEMLGYTAEEMQGKHLFEFMDERGVEIAQRGLQRRQQGIKEQHEFEFVRKDGTRLYAALETGPITDGDGNYIGALAGVQDITARKRMEAAEALHRETLRKSEAFNQAVIDHSPLGTSVRDRLGRLLFANDVWKQIWAIPEAEVRADSTREREELAFDTRDDYLRPYHAEVRRVYEQGGYLHLPELRITYPRPGAAEWVAQYFYAIQNEQGQVDRVVILTEDITARKRAEATLRESEENYRQLFEAESDAIFLIDNQTGQILQANNAACAMYGYSREELLCKKNADLSAEPEQTQRVTQDTLPLPQEVITIPLRWHRKRSPMSRRCAGCCPFARPARRSGTTGAIGINWKSTSPSTRKRISRTGFARTARKNCTPSSLSRMSRSIYSGAWWEPGTRGGPHAREREDPGATGPGSSRPAPSGGGTGGHSGRTPAGIRVTVSHYHGFDGRRDPCGGRRFAICLDQSGLHQVESGAGPGDRRGWPNGIRGFSFPARESSC